MYEAINHNLTEKIIKNYNPDVIHETYYSLKKYKGKVKTVCTVYDMINEVYPIFFNNHEQITSIKRATINRADKVICISQKTKEDLINYFSIDEKKIKVIYLASGFKKNEQKIKLKKKFPNHLLFVGSRHGYKNYNNFITAYSKSKNLKNNFKIIFFGGEKVGNVDYQIIKKNKLNSQNILFLNDRQTSLPFLYSNVAALVYPSLYEGFGLPIIEAMSFACPVISSNGGALNEIGGDGIEYFNPLDIDDISFKLDKILSSNEILKNQIRYGVKRSQKFSWENCAKETLAVYNKVR